MATPPSHTRARRLGAALSKHFDGVRVVGDDDALQPRGLWSGMDSLDVAIGGPGGLPEGRIVTYHGAEACGKTTACLAAVKECQDAGGVAFFMDFESKLDLSYAESLGVDVRAMVHCIPPYIEKGFDFIADALGRARAIDPDMPILFVWDSLHGAIAKRSFNADNSKDAFGPEAGAYSRCLPKLVPKLSASRATLILVSQVRIKIDGFITKEKIGVGNAPLFYSTLIVRLKAVRGGARGSVAKGRTGETVVAILKKNQVSVPYRTASWRIVYGTGIDRYACSLDAAVQVGLAVPGKGGWYEVEIGGEVVKVQGPAGLAALAADNPEAYQGLRVAIHDLIGKVELVPLPSPAKAEADKDDGTDADADDDLED